MVKFKGPQTILSYIHHNNIDVIELINKFNQKEVARILTTSNNIYDSISQPKLSHIMQYINENVERTTFKWNLVLPEFRPQQNIVNYIKEYHEIVYNYSLLVGQVETARQLTIMCKMKYKMSQPKLSHILNYIGEELSNYDN